MRTIDQIREDYRAVPDGGVMLLTVSELRLVERQGLEPDTGPTIWKGPSVSEPFPKHFRIENDPPEDITKETISGS